jgi:hypothetical protein
MENKIKEFFKRYDFSQVESDDNSLMIFHYVEDDYVWKVKIGIKDNDIKYIEFIEDGWINRPMEFPEDFEKFYCIVDDWIWDMGLHPDDERREFYV